MKTQAQGGSSLVSHFGTPPLITSMPHAGAQRSTSEDSLTVSRSVMLVRNINIWSTYQQQFCWRLFFSHAWKLDVVYRQSYLCCASWCFSVLCCHILVTLSLQLSCRMVRSSARVAGKMKRGGGHGLQGVCPHFPWHVHFQCIILVPAMSQFSHMQHLCMWLKCLLGSQAKPIRYVKL